MTAPRLVLVTGMSGSGKSVALRTLEDHGFHCVDNLPAEMLPGWARRMIADDGIPVDKMAASIDVRSRSDLARTPEWLGEVGAIGLDPQLVFLESADEVLVKRYAESRAKHPLSHLGLALADSLRLERQALKPLRALADVVIDTSSLNVHQLRRALTNELQLSSDHSLSLLFESFAYKRGIPSDADFVLDVRMLPNPHWEPALRPLSGRDKAVREYFEGEPEVTTYLRQITEFLDTWLPKLQDDTRSYVTVAFGCTGGRHRSVYLAETIAEHARARGWQEVATFHRELE
ncbi:RNase adapter RapZ [Solilutibacter silvestris]|uniref:Putative P-loop-containing kinase n=1 Tax=Solilutibacter silvestris TaxID=1645665 RepID=A0A2K1Q2U9_9GAMM|nr:RNase adapter RapZ [Lysobacter silvestris]PNS09369.1 putative P-loop-containing kinase [Lysobacter silvestris]